MIRVSSRPEVTKIIFVLTHSMISFMHIQAILTDILYMECVLTCLFFGTLSK